MGVYKRIQCESNMHYQWTDSNDYRVANFVENIQGLLKDSEVPLQTYSSDVLHVKESIPCFWNHIKLV